MPRLIFSKNDAISPLEGIETFFLCIALRLIFDAISPLEGIETIKCQSAKHIPEMQLARLRVLKQRGYRHSDGDRRDAISPLEGIETI